MNPTDNPVERLMRAAFVDNQTRTPRSGAYKEGCRAALAYRLDVGARITLPYAEGTAEADAFFAGVDEGHFIFRMKGDAG